MGFVSLVISQHSMIKGSRHRWKIEDFLVVEMYEELILVTHVEVLWGKKHTFVTIFYSNPLIWGIYLFIYFILLFILLFYFIFCVCVLGKGGGGGGGGSRQGTPSERTSLS